MPNNRNNPHPQDSESEESIWNFSQSEQMIEERQTEEQQPIAPFDNDLEKRVFEVFGNLDEVEASDLDEP